MRRPDAVTRDTIAGKANSDPGPVLVKLGIKAQRIIPPMAYSVRGHGAIKDKIARW